jgi:hypothetical protein
MVFLSPLFLFGLFAAMIPIAIHLIRKEKPPKLMFSTIRFLKKTSRKLVLFQQIQQWLLLALRAALIALLVIAFARPLFNLAVARMLETDPQSLVILLDNSMSMRYADRFARAKRAALDVIEDMRAGDEAALLLFSSGVDAIAELTTDTDSLRARLQSLDQPGYGTTRYMPNLRLADQMLSASRFNNRAIVMISDFQQLGLTDAETGWKLAPGVTFSGINLGTDDSSNLVLSDVRAPVKLLEGAEAQSVLARVRSTGTVHLNQAEVSLTVDGTLLDRQRVDLSNTSEAVVSMSALFETAGVHVGQVTVNGDNFSVDNNFYFSVEVSPKIKVLLVNGESSNNWYDDEAHWFGLAVSSAAESPFQLQVTEPTRLDVARMEQQDVLVLLNVGNLSTSQAAAVIDYVRSGGKLFIAPGDRIDTQRFNQQFAEVLPALISVPDFNAGDDYLVVADFDRRHPILRPLTSDWAARFTQYFDLTPNDAATVLMRFDNTRPALVEGDAGEGKVILFASAMDQEWNNLPLQGMYLPFVHQILRHLAEPAARQSAYSIGQTIDLGLDARQVVSITRPDGNDLAFDAANPVINAREPGIYRVANADSEILYAVNVLAEEANFRRTTVAEIHDDIINPDTSPIQSREVRTAQLIEELEQPQRIWWWVLGLVMLMILAEGRIANRTYR